MASGQLTPKATLKIVKVTILCFPNKEVTIFATIFFLPNEYGTIFDTVFTHAKARLGDPIRKMCPKVCIARLEN